MKTITYSISILLLISSIAAIGIGQHATIEEKNLSFSFFEPTYTSTDDYLNIHIPGANTVHFDDGKPLLPMQTTKITLPFGTQIINLKVTPDSIYTQHLTKKIQPAPNSLLLNGEPQTITYTPDASIYASTDFYPAAWCTYTTGGGLDENKQHKTFLIIHTYPARYSPATNTLQYTTHLNLQLTYKEPEHPQTFPEINDLLIIAPTKFQATLQPLITHKISKGINTTLITTESIYTDFTGVDKPEQIKYAIKDSMETSGTKYVLLVGGLNSYFSAQRRDDKNQGSVDWYVPVRYTNLREGGSIYDPGYISDLYYADIYDGNGSFSSWDSTGDGIFANWYSGPKDIIDLYPDVYIGRLPCRNTLEVKIMVQKIIDYETGTASADWYDTMIVVSGDSFEDPPVNLAEGEEVTNQVITTTMTGFTHVTLYASLNETEPDMVPTAKNVIREVSKGAGHLLFDGHGSPRSWNTHYPGVFDSWVGATRIQHFIRYTNKQKYPVCVVGACHSSMFNITLLSNLRDNETNYLFTWCYGVPIPECWSWWLTRKINGGSIATMGNTGLGYGITGENGDLDGDGIVEPDCTETRGGYQEIVFYEAFDEGYDILGETWGMAESKYLDTHPGMDNQIDCKTVQQWALLGDPSLKIGGYSS